MLHINNANMETKLYEDMKTTIVDLTESHKEYFRQRCLHYYQFFGLFQWQVFYLYKNDHEGCQIADIMCDKNTHTAKLTLNMCYDLSLARTEEEVIRGLDRTAFHEIIHLLLADLVSCLYTRFVTEKQCDDEEEALVRRFESTLYHYVRDENYVVPKTNSTAELLHDIPERGI